MEPVPPTKELLVQLIEQLINGEVSRQDLVEWRNAVIRKFGYVSPGTLSVPLSNADGYWQFVGLGILLETGEFNEAPSDHFVRVNDLREWLAVLLRTESPEETAGPVTRIRWGAPPPRDRYVELLTYLDPAGATLKALGVTMERIVYSDLGDLTERALVAFEGWRFIVRKSHFFNRGEVILEGEADCPPQVAGNFVVFLGISPPMLTWVSTFAFPGACALHRTDDNANEFVVSRHDAYLEARVHQAAYERKGHKQTYFVQEL